MAATSKAKARGIAEGYRSGLEEKVAAQLAEAGVSAEYEKHKIMFVQPTKERSYTPDFILPNGIIVETKGRFVTADRQKHKWIKEQHPELEIRFVFSRSTSKLSKVSKTTYGDWCRYNGFVYHDLVIPMEWWIEPTQLSRQSAIKRAAIKAKDRAE